VKSRADALELLHEYTKSESLRRHSYAVEASMRACAEKFGEDVEKWGITGLLHDFDYERFPSLEEHTVVGSRILREQGYPEEIIHAIAGHTSYHNVPRDTLMAKALYACDEISGFVMAVAMVRPTRTVTTVEVKSVKKKLKDKAFAKGVRREDVYEGAAELGVDLDSHIALVIGALSGVAQELGLDGSVSA
jgi:putative nucleotidyltransferase with HDIG domain